MPGCVAPDCSNSSAKKFKMCHFPLKDPKRCAIWIKNVKRKNWTPNKYSTLCQVRIKMKFCFIFNLFIIFNNHIKFLIIYERFTLHRKLGNNIELMDC